MSSPKIYATPPRIRYTADGVTSAFDFPFVVLAPSDVAVFCDSTRKTLNVNYTVSGAGNEDGGTITFLGPIPPAGTIITITRDSTIQRVTDFAAGVPIRADTLNEELDRLTTIDQELADRVDRTFSLPMDEAAADLTLPTKTSRAGKALGFDASGLPIAIDPGTGGGGGGGGVTDHGALTGLGDDDHPHYHTDARGDARYSSLGHMHETLYLPINTKIDDLATPDDNTDLNASASRHGLLRKLSGNAAEFLDGSGAWSVPPANVPPDLNGLTDVVITGPVLPGHTLQWNGTNWVNAAPGTVFAFSIASFTSNQATPQLIGPAVNVWRAIGAITFSATYNNPPPASATVNIVSGATPWGVPLNMGAPNYIGPTPTVNAILYPSGPNTSIVFRLTAVHGGTNYTRDVSIYFNNYVYWGTTTKAGGYGSADVAALSKEITTSNIKAPPGGSFTVNASGGAFIIYAHPTRLGLATFTVGPFSGGFLAPETVSMTNAAGYTEDYYVYRSDQADLGDTTVVVT